MRKQEKVALFFLLPYLIVFIMFRLGPSIAGILVSFTKWDIIGNPQFIGFKNFWYLFQDQNFHIALKNTFLFLLLTAPPLVLFSLLFAVLLNQGMKGKNLVRTIVFSPYVIMPAVIGIIWNWLYDNNFGIINYYLRFIGLRPIEWLTSENWALFAVSIVTVWSLVGYNMILYLAGLQGIDNGLYEAARIDGANGFQMFIKLTVPMLAPVTSMIVTLTLINTVQIFDQIYVMTSGGPGTATLTLVQYMYGQAFQNFTLGYGSSIGFVILLILTGLVLFQSKVIKAES
ncbi:carbohydrate ABC transporter membrane protein 1 (CUT1 family) [Hydrogenispora ethanolica]|jgi:multiple sugar transport system permease protein|uniref:Carbohydrate ABC transporter membrane protein 1 (CUT1 family) n=1 Tax=Hydrogenispora ethanolica TaxID=1082276 RepID=A0A4R1RFA2_HYDET|nr:sugar ABC transporter permease [Hydrogenispora ethanolica]TCL64252.1 carbohydrate ABC transporter membrane protein 1 (CUT1 family) [Hydrogenispora ethanolica]